MPPVRRRAGPLAPLAPATSLAALTLTPVARCRGPAPTRPRTHPVQTGTKKLPFSTARSKGIGAEMWRRKGAAMADKPLHRHQFFLDCNQLGNSAQLFKRLGRHCCGNRFECWKQCVRLTASTGQDRAIHMRDHVNQSSSHSDIAHEAGTNHGRSTIRSLERRGNSLKTDVSQFRPSRPMMMMRSGTPPAPGHWCATASRHMGRHKGRVP